MNDRYIQELMQFLQGANGKALKSKYAPPPAPAAHAETPEERMARKKAEYMEETGSDESAEVPGGLNGAASTEMKKNQAVPPTGTMYSSDKEEHLRQRHEDLKEPSTIEQIFSFLGFDPKGRP